MRLVATIKDSNRNQKATNFNYDQISLSIFWKTTYNQFRMASDKIYTQNTIRFFFGTNMGLFLNATWRQVA